MQKAEAIRLCVPGLLMSYAQKLHSANILSCLYSGRDCDIEDWMQAFDYIKIGSYKEELGLLFECTTTCRHGMEQIQHYFDKKEG